MFLEIGSEYEFEKYIKSNRAVLGYFSTTECQVCKSLKPKIESSIRSRFPEIRLVYIEINHSPNIASKFQVLNIPTVIVYFEGKEFIRKSRVFSIHILNNEIQRIYDIFI